MKIAIVIARSGSKRIKNKNIKNFCGRLIIVIIIKKLIDFKIFDKVIVSTDSKKISKIATKVGSTVPFLRSKKLSNDYVGTHDVILDTILKLKKKINLNPDIVCCVYPTAVFFKKKEIIKALKLINSNTVEYAFTATKASASLFRSFYYSNKKLKKFNKNYYSKRTQDLPQLFYDIGQFYVAKKEVWLKQKNIFSNKSKFIEVPKNRSYDIDDIDDWKIAEKLYLVNE